MGMDKVKFRKIVVPGDQMILNVKVIRQRSKAVKMAGTASVNQKIVAEAETVTNFVRHQLNQVFVHELLLQFGLAGEVARQDFSGSYGYVME